MAKSASILMTLPIRHRTSVIALCALLLCGCSSEGGGDWANVFAVVRQSWSGNASAVTLEQASAIPYATLGVRIGGGPQTLVVLGADQNGHLLWTSAAKIAVETENGRVVRTAGFPGDLSGISFSNGDPLVTFERGGRDRQEDARTVDVRDMKVYGAPATCSLSSVGADTIEILGSKIQTEKVEERCRVSALDWDFENTFWIDSSGLVWKSIQHIHPKQYPLIIEVLRPAG